MLKKKADGRRAGQYFFIFVALMILTVCLLCFASVLGLRRTTVEQTEKYLDEFSSSVKQLVEERIEYSLNFLETVAVNYTYNQHTDGTYNMEVLQGRAELMDLTHIIVLDEEGRGTAPDGTAVDYSENPYIMRVYQGERALAPADELHSTGRGNEFLLAVPIYDGDAITGALVACTASSWTNDWLLPSFLGGEMFFHLIMEDGSYLLRSNSPYVSEILEKYPEMDQQTQFEVMEQNAKLKDGVLMEQIRAAAADGQTAMVHFSYEQDELQRISCLIPLEYDGVFLWVSMVQGTVSQIYHEYYTWSLVINGIIVLVFIALSILLYRLYQRNFRLAFVDPVTGGYSPIRFQIEAERKIRASAPGELQLISVNIDKFKAINDLFGVERGDDVLKYVYRFLCRHQEKGELVVRSFADRFQILARARSEAAVIAGFEQISQDINEDIRKYTYEKDGKEDNYLLSLRVGVYRIDEPDLPLTLIQDRAQMAQDLHARLLPDHLGTCGFYTDEDRERLLWEKELENKMEGALESHDFVVFLQPKVDLKSGELAGAEGLIRWQDPDCGLILPDRFIPIFEKSGFIRRLDLYVFEEICRYLRGRIDEGKKVVPVSVNLSPSVIGRADFLEPYIALQKQYGIPPQLLDFELTETIFLEDAGVAIQAIKRIHEAGFFCSLDDFGSGYSSLNLLREISVDTLKLDRAFLVSADMDDPRERAVIEEVVRLAKRLGMECCAEGVETAKQSAFLASIRCEKGQGYLYSQPAPAEEFERFYSCRFAPLGTEQEGEEG